MRLKFTAACVMTLAGLLPPSVASAETLKSRDVYTIGDAMGQTQGWSKDVHNFYDSEGKLSRRIDYYRAQITVGDNVGDYTVDLYQCAYYTYDENGNILEERVARAQPTDNVNTKEYTFKDNSRLAYTYGDDGKLTQKDYTTWSAYVIALKGPGWKQGWRYVYEYDEAGRVSKEQYWATYQEGKAPNTTTTYTYDGTNTKPSKTTTLGQYAYQCYETDYTYDKQGHLIHTLSVNLGTDGSNLGTTKESVEYEYDGDFCTAVHKYDANNNPTGKTDYEKINGDPNHYTEKSYKWRAETDDDGNPVMDDNNEPVGTWIMNPVTYGEYIIQDYADAANYIPEIKVTKEDEEATDINVKIKFADCNSAAYEARVYRDGYIIATLDKEALAAAKGTDGWYTVAVDSNLKNGEHEYYALIATGNAGQESADFKEGYISEPATITVSKTYPAVSGLEVKGYTVTRSWLPPSEDELEDGTVEHYPGSWSEITKLQISWTPLTETETEGLGFAGYYIYYTNQAGYKVCAEQIEDITTSEATIDWSETNKELWIAAKFNSEFAESEHLATNFSTFTNLTVIDPVPVYGVINYGGYTPAFVKADLSKPDAAVEVIYDLYGDSGADLNCIKGGVSVGDNYYAMYVSNDDDETYMGAFDMTNKSFVKLNKVDNEYSDMTYDEKTDKIYAVVPGTRRSTIYTIDPITGLGTATELPVPANANYIASNGEGIIYVLTAADSKYAFYSIDIAGEKYELDTDIELEGKPYKWSSLYYEKASATLYFTNNKQLWTIRPSDKAVWKEPVSLKSAMAGVTDKASTTLPVEPKTSNPLTVVSEVAGGVQTDYFYNCWNQLVREVANGEDATAGYTKYTYLENGKLASKTEYKPVVDKYGVETMAEALTTTYTYDEETGQLTGSTNSNGVTATYIYEMGDYPSYIIYSGENESDNYAAVCYYDENGNKVMEAHTPDLMSGMFTSMEEWKYEEGSNVMTSYMIMDVETEEPTTVVTYTASEEDPMLYVATVEGETVEGIVTERRYADYTESAELAFAKIMVAESEDGVNNANVLFSVPEAIYNDVEMFSIRLWRDCEMIADLDMQALSELMSETGILYTDEAVPNGQHEYFLQPVWDGTAYQVSAAEEGVEFNTELPAVSSIAFDSVAEVEGTNMVTISWVNPEYDAAYGFISNNPFIEGETPVAGTVVTDAAATTVALDFGSADEANIMIQTRYALGNANSEVTPITVVSVDGIAADGLTVNIVNKTVIVNMAADIRVFDAAGALVASANGATTLDLSGLNGVYFVTVAKEAAAKVVKARL